TDRDIQQRHAALFGKALERLDPVERLVREDLVAAAQPRAFRSRLTTAILPGQQATGKREVRQHADAEPRAGREQLLLGLAPQEGAPVLGPDRSRDAARPC